MGRLLATVYEITGELVAETPIHIGGAGDDLVLDMPLAVDGEGKFCLPGTSLTGPIRAWWARAFSGAEAERLFGRPARSDKDEGHASHVRITDAPLLDPEEKIVQEIRDGVGIDRHSGTAAEGIKYDRAILPLGARFEFRMTIEVPACVDTAYVPAELFADPAPKFGPLLTTLEAGAIRFGAAKTRGLGKMRLVKTEVFKRTLGSNEGILKFLRAPGKGDDVGTEWKKRSTEISHEINRNVLDITIAWKPELPVMSRSGVDGFLVDILPFVTARGADMVPVLAGSSIKGALRSHAERIWRTKAGEDAPTTDHRDNFIHQLKKAKLPNMLFGAVAEKPSPAGQSSDERNANRPALPGLGAVSVEDCLLGKGLPMRSWRDLVSRITDEHGKLIDDKQRLNEARSLLSHWQDHALPIAHVAIDRWTGGAAESALFSTLEFREDEPHTIRISVDLDRIAFAGDHEANRARDTNAALALLLFTLRDLANGKIPLGFGSNRGLGSIKVVGIEIDGPAPFLKGTLTFDATCMATFQDIDDSWKAYWRDYAARGAKPDKIQKDEAA